MSAHLSEFFVAAVVVALVGNAAEHGSAVLLAARGQIKLAAEIARASSPQVAGFLIPVVALLSWAIDPLALAFGPIEIAAHGRRGRRRRRGTRTGAGCREAIWAAPSS